MTLRTIGNTRVQYHLISFDEDGIELREHDSPPESETLRALVADPAQAITDVFLASHGWKGDIPAAIEQCDLWMGEMARAADLPAMRVRHPDFKPLNIGIHWPSLPFGDENLLASHESRTLSADDEPDIAQQVDQYAASLADTPVARAAIRTILEAAAEGDGSPEELPDEVREAYETLFAEAGLAGGAENLGAPPGADHPPFDADEMFAAARDAEPEDADDDARVLGVRETLANLLIVPMQQASFWKMKNRARVVGENGVHRLLVTLMRAAPSARVHLMGHSFGCIVVSAAVAGAPRAEPLPRPVDTLFLVQGALSLWAFAPDIPYAPGTRGYFNQIIARGLVRGPIVTTRSSHDRAVGRLYPPAARLRSQLVLGDEYPKYGGIGTFGAQGLGDGATDGEMQSPSYAYRFEPGRVYNLEASEIVRNGGGFSGAHSDIAHPEVAHVMWEAIAATR